MERREWGQSATQGGAVGLGRGQRSRGGGEVVFIFLIYFLNCSYVVIFSCVQLSIE